MYRQLVVVCLFLALAAEAKNSFFKRSSLDHGKAATSERAVDEEARFREHMADMVKLDCLRATEETCGSPSVFPQGSNAMSILANTDMSQICSSMNEWVTCALAAHESIEDCQLAIQQHPRFRQERELYTRSLQFVCVQHVDVINRHKACLLKQGERGLPELTMKIMMTCMQHMQALNDRTNPYCLPSGYVQCAKTVVVTECGQEIADVAEEFVNLLTAEFCSAPSLASRSFNKRLATDNLELLKEMFKSFF